MKWVKKGSAAAAAFVFGLVWLLVWVFLDPLIKRALVSAGEAAAGAKVEIGSVRTRLLRGDLLVQSVFVADKHEPMKNLFQLDRADFRFSPRAALEAKAVIENAELSGLQFGTPRKTSGALPARRRRSSAFEKKIEEQLAPAKQESLAKLGQVKKLAAKVDPSKLSSTQALAAAQEKLKELGGRTKDQLGVDQLDAQIKDIQKQVASLQAGGGSPADLAAKAQTAAQLQGRIKALLGQVQASKQRVAEGYGQVQQALLKASDLKSRDVNALLAAAGVPALDAQSMTRRLLGPAAARKLETALYWVRWARRRQAVSQRAKAKQAPPLRRGVDIEFPNARSYPAFLLVQASLSGRLSKLLAGQDMDLAGRLGGLTSNPPLYGKPATLSLSGRAARGLSMALEGLVDDTKPDGPTRLKLSYAGFPLSGLSLGDGELAALATGGVGRVDGTLSIVGDQWKGRFTLEADGVRLSPKLQLSGPAEGYARQALSSVRRFSADVGVEGTQDDLRVTIASDLGKTLSDAVKKAASSALLAQRKELQAKVEAAYAQRAKPIQDQAAALQKQLLAPLDREQQQLDDALKRAVSRAVPLQGLPKGLALPKFR